MWALCSKDVVKSVVKYPLKSSYFGKRMVRSDVSPEMKAKFQQVEVGDTATKTNLRFKKITEWKKIPTQKSQATQQVGPRARAMAKLSGCSGMEKYWAIEEDNEVKVAT